MNALEYTERNGNPNEGTWMSDEQINELNRNTRVPMGVAVSCAIAFIGGALWLNNSLSQINNRLAAMEQRMTDRWTGSDMKIWVLRFRMENPSVKVPEPDTK